MRFYKQICGFGLLQLELHTQGGYSDIFSVALTAGLLLLCRF